MASRRDAQVDTIWSDFKAVCAALRNAKNITERSKSVAQVQSFLSDDLHRQFVHKWRAWGLLVSSLLHVVKSDAQPYLNSSSSGSGASLNSTAPRGKDARASSSASASKKRRVKTSRAAPKLKYWTYLRNEFAAVHAVDGPLLHLDPNGRDCVSQLFGFAVVVVGRGAFQDEDPHVAARLELEAWQTIQLIVQYRVYCAVLEQNQLRDVLELALASLDHGNTIGSSSSASLRATIIQQILKNCPFDLHEWLPKLLSFFGNWFEQIVPGSSGKCAKNVEDVAPKLLEAVTELIKSYFSSIGLLVLRNGVKILHYIQRSWKNTPFRLRGCQTEYIVQFLSLYACNTQDIILIGKQAEIDPVTLLKDMKVLLGMLLNPKEIQQLLLHSKSARGSLLASGGGGGSAFNVLIDLDAQITSYFRCAADVVCHHDRLVAELSEHDMVLDNAHMDPKRSAGMKRGRPISSELAWESLLENICIDSPTETNDSVSSLSSSSSALSPGRLLSSARDARSSQRTAIQKQHVSWLVLHLAVLCRHGEYYLTNRIGDMMTVMEQLLHILEAKELEQRQYVALLALVQLSHLSARCRELCSDLLDDVWQKIWRCLLRPDLPYVHATESAVLSKEYPGDIVVGLLSNCVSFGLVPHAVVEASQSQLWSLPVFRSGINGLTTASRSVSAMNTTASVSPVRLLNALLQCIELQDEESDGATLPSQFIAGSAVPSGPPSVRSSLLSALFTHLEIQAFHEAGSGMAASKASEAAAVSPISYASAVLSFIRPSRSPDMLHARTCLTTKLLRNLGAVTEEGDSNGCDYGLDGFGVYFTMHDAGLASLYTPSPATPAPHRFSSIIQDYVDDCSFDSSSQAAIGVSDRHDKFERLKLPTHLLGPLLRQAEGNANLPIERPQWTQAGFPSISKETQLAMHAEVSGYFSRILDDLSHKFCSVGMDSRGSLQLLAGTLHVGLVLAALFTALPQSVDGDGMVDIGHLLKKLLALIAENLKASAFEQALRDPSAAQSVVQFLMSLHSFILILQGKSTLVGCSHPSADPVDLRIPSKLRPSIRKVVGAIEEGLARVATGANSFASDRAGSQLSASSLGGWGSAVSSSQTRSTPPSQGAVVTSDAFEDGNGRQRNVGANSLILKTISLWCFRVLLLLKKDSGLKTISNLAMEVQFTPDFLLALSALLCGVAGCDSLELLMKLLDYATDEASREGRRNSQRGGSSRTALFSSQALTVLKLAGLMHERRKSQHNEDIPEQLLQYARKFLDETTAHGSKEALRIARQAEVECLEVFFRLNPDVFADFVDTSMRRLVDVDFSVRVSAVCSAQTLFYMYPEGGTQLFKDLYQCLLPLLPGCCPRGDAEGNDNAGQRSGSREIGSVDCCVTVMLALYVSACSSEDVIPEALVVFIRLALSELPMYSSPSSPFLHAWLRAIASEYSYPTVSRLLDDHFCYLWSQFIAINMHVASESEEGRKKRAMAARSSAKDLLEQFPMPLLSGSTQTHRGSTSDLFADKVDIIFPVGVLYDSIGDGGPLEEFSFVNDLVDFFSRPSAHNGGDQVAAVRSAVEEQLITDLFALSFVLQSSPDPALQEIAARMLAVAEEKATTSALSIAHLGHVVCKMARFTIWDLARASDQPSESDLWKKSITNMKEKYSGFDWTRMNIAELLSEFYVMLLRTELSEPISTRAVHCFYLFVREVQSAFESSFVLQQLLLRICFQAIKQLASRRKEVAKRLTLLVRETCEQFMKSPNIFGKYLSFVVHEISDILSRCDDVHGHLQLSLEGDDKGQLEWVVFAVCNNMANGLGKYILDIDAVPMGVSSSLDKLNSLILGSRKVVAPEDDKKSALSFISSGSKSSNSLRQIETFIQKASEVGDKFYHQSRLLRSSATGRLQGVRSKYVVRQNDATVYGTTKAPSTSLLRLATVERSVGEIEDAYGRNARDQTTPELIGKLTKTLFYLSSSQNTIELQQRGGNDQESDILVSIADALSAVGALDGNQSDLNPGSETAYLSRLYHQQFNRGALRETKVNFLPTMYERLFVYLSSLLFEEKELGSDVIQQAVIAMKSLLRLDEGCAALAKCKDGELKEFLNPFVQSPPSNWSTSSLMVRQILLHEARILASQQQQHVQLWKAGRSLGFDVWVRSMASYLASRSSDPVLRACTTLVRVRTEMAIFLFPYVLWSILRKQSPEEEEAGDLSRVAKVVQTGIRDIFASAAKQRSVATSAESDANSSAEPLEIVQLLIHSVTFLREIEKAHFVESNGRGMLSKSNSEKDRKSSTARSSGRPQDSKQAAYGCLVDVDLLDVAVAAIDAKMPYSAMQYVEMWLEEKHGGMIPSLLSSTHEELDENARRILVDAYSFDNNVDGIYGINDGRTLDSQLITYNREGSFAKALPLYDVSLQCRSAMDATQTSQLLEGMLTSLRNLGYHNLLEGYLQSLDTTLPATSVSPRMDEFKYELAWKSLQWGSAGASLPPSSSSCVDSVGGAQQHAPYRHQQVLYQSLKALAHGDTNYLFLLTKKSKEQILQSVQLSLCGLESTRDSYKALLWLESIRDIEECAQVVMNATRNAPTASNAFQPAGALRNPLESAAEASTSLHTLFELWQKRYPRIQNDFEKVENLLALQEVLIKVTDAPDSHQILSRLHLSLASVSRKANRVAVACNALMKLEQMNDQGVLGVYQKMQWKMEKAKLLWTQQEARSAIWTAKLLRSDLERSLLDPATPDHKESLEMLHVAVLTVTGKWIASQRSESSQVIIEEYFQKATDLVDAMDAAVISKRVGDAAKAHLALAEYMADMHHQVNTRVTSREWLAGKRVAEARRRELAECLAMSQAKQVENRAHIHALNKEVQYDYEERTKVEASVDQFLTGALRSYGKGLALSPKAELAVVFRLLSLWFSNQLKAGVNDVVQEVIEVVPSYKFVPLSYQIISRIGTSKSSRSKDPSAIFQRVLSVLVLKLCQQHPHHALVQLIALKNSGDVEGKGALEFRANVGDAKSEGAKRYVEKLRKANQRELLESLDILSTAYIQLALFDTRDYHKLGKKIPLSNVPIVGLSSGAHSHHAVSFDQCLRDRTRRGANRTVMPAVLTCNVAPRADMDYSGVVRVLSFEPMFSITDSGIHRPKIIYCYGSNGRRFKQLVKGKDDTRQDLVIEQAFETVNHFLKEDQQTRQRNLRLRTYKVVPLSPIAGVLEWVDNTMPWGSYLVGRTAKKLSAHERYHPNEWKHTDCRMYLKNATDKFAAYKDIEANFTPVFHHFFLEKFPDPAMWYQRRLAYVKSAAVTSIVGYILGIGDRHSQNILVHEETAELVHIDFGVVFDQGMALFTPETVPFRLTRDLVDGMGVSGCEGVFARCCEATLQLLRKKSASVVTILEVFVHDPLYRWTLSPLKALRIQEEEKGGVSGRATSTSSIDSDDSTTAEVAQNAGSSNNNDAAARALIRVKQKLEGYEDPNGNALSIEGQVKQLISAAQDPHNLCNLFPGWAPWL